MIRLTTVAALAAVLLAGALPRAQPPSRTRLVMLGTGTPNADPDRYGPAVAVVVDETSYLVDFGVGVVRRAAAAERSGITALAAPRLTRAFATHLHSDHTLGLADLILTPWILERPSPLELYGPRGLRSMTHHIVSAYADDLRIRTRGGEPKHGYDPRIVNVHEIAPGFVYRDERVTVTAFAVKHGAWEQAFGYRFQTPDRTIVISGDSGPDSHLEAQCQRCDVLVHEVYSGAGFAKRPPEWQAYHARYHTSARELGAIATRAQPGLLVLYHQLIWSSTEEELLKEVRSAYDGKVVSAHDLDVF
jgi:ribonuclease BN (tRNA processing enzyme)